MPTNPTPTFESLTLSGGTVTGVTNAVNPSDVVPFQQTFVASGASAAAGLVPSPGTTAGSTRFLREDATWAAPAGGGASGAGVQHLPTSLGANYSFAANCSYPEGTTTLAIISGYVLYVPFIVDRSVTVTQLGFSGSATSATTVSLGVYSDSGNTPGSLLTSGSISATSTSQIYTASVTSLALNAGTLYWAAIQSASANITTYASSNPIFSLGTYIVNAGAASLLTYTLRYQSASSLPSTGAATGIQSGQIPLIFFNG